MSFLSSHHLWMATAFPANTGGQGGCRCHLSCPMVQSSPKGVQSTQALHCGDPALHLRVLEAQRVLNPGHPASCPHSSPGLTLQKQLSGSSLWGLSLGGSRWGMSWGFGAGYPLHTPRPPPYPSLLKSLLWPGAGAEASGEVDGIQGRAAGTTMDQEQEDVGSACDKVSRPHPHPPKGL